MAGSIPGILVFFASAITVAGIYSIMGMSLNLRFGYTGIFDFGIVLFFMIGSYGMAVLTASPGAVDHLGFGLPVLIAVPLVLLLAGAIAVAIGIPALRIRAEYFALATLAFGEIARFIFINEEWLAGGTFGTQSSVRPLADLMSSSLYQIFYAGVSVGALILVYLFLRKLVDSPFGRVLRAVRENPTAVRAVGKNPYRIRMKSWVLSAAVASIAGIVWVPNISVVTPNQFMPIVTVIVWVGMLFGGRGNFFGVAVGAFLIKFAQDMFQLVPIIGNSPSLIPVVQKLLLAILIIGVIFYKPEGIFPERKHLIHDP